MFDFVKDILQMSKDRKNKIILSYFLSFFEAGIGNLPLFLSAYLIGDLFSSHLNEDAVLIVLSIIIVSILIRTILRYYISKLDQGSSVFMFSDERLFTGAVLRKQDMGFYSQNNIGNIISVLTNDMAFIENNGVFALAKLTCALVSVGLSVVVLWIVDIRIGLLYLFITACSIFLLSIFHKKSVKDAEVLKEAFRDLIDSVVEYIQGIAVIKAFHLSEDRFDKVTNSFEKTREIYTRYELKSIPFLLVNMIFCSIGSASIVFISAQMGINDPSILPFTVFLLLYSFGAFTPLMNIATTISMINVSKAGLDRYQVIKNMETYEEVSQSKDTLELKSTDIEFQDVSFAYENENVLNHIDLVFRQGEMTAIVGESGSGKSTLMNLIARFWRVKEGMITIGGVNINAMHSENFYKNFSMVFQNVYLFHDTILNNLTMGNENALPEEIVEACKKARCYEFIMNLPKGFDTIVGEGGSSLSGGEKQRISIARAIIKDAPIVLLDEATASVDLDNEAYIQEAIDELVRNKTLIVISHKLSSVKCADKIVVLKDHKVAEVGTHEELVQLDGEYKKLWNVRIKEKIE